ncbi:peptidase C39 family protein [Candidatus Thalassolituus haligoni]|uniref:peptidase C39 family protein n=1 Tax=Candidatus Thalassolituus haligoni TaxID=3100113 RepID=UPI00351312C3
MTDFLIRPAVEADLAQLVMLENSTFTTDQLSRRSFRHFIRHAHASVLVAEQAGEMAGYVLVLYRRGTWLARVYSLAVALRFRGQRLGQQLMAVAEQTAEQHDCAFVRLEVSVCNTVACQLYKATGFKTIARLPQYYANGDDGVRMEKALYRKRSNPVRPTTYYEQTTDFTCGPASLMMGLHSLNPEYQMSRREELQIWREATTIFMTTGHGGCSPHGLALSAYQRGAQVRLYVSHNGVPFIDGVRGDHKKAVIELVHQDFVERLADTTVTLVEQSLTLEQLRQHLQQGEVLVCLISTWRLNRNRAPHWVVVTFADEDYVYLTDPDFEKEEGQSSTDFIDVPIRHDEFIHMASFGRQRLKCTLVLSRAL